MKDFGNQTVIYTKTTCPHCIDAKRILTERGYTYTEIVLDGQSVTKDTMCADIGRELNTVPQIILNGNFIPGGCSGLKKHLGV